MMNRRRLIACVFGCLGLLASALTSTSIFAAPVQMDEQQFWSLVKEVKREAGPNIEARPRLLQKKLSTLPREAIEAFQKRYEALLIDANRWSLWGAAYLMNGGCSDDCFRYFRDWLISEGQSTFEAALAHPESLESFERREFFELESFGYAATKAFAANGAGELNRDFQLELALPKGKEWSETELPKLFPRLAAKYGAK